MKNLLKKIFTLTLSLGILTLSASAAFVDMPSDPIQKSALENAVKNGLLNGIGGDMIAPNNTITRAQMGAILVRSMGAEKEADISFFGDVSKDAWYYREMSRAVAMGAFKGDGFNLNPENPITYQEAFLVLSRVFDLRYIDNSCLDKFADNSTVADWAADGVKKIVSGGYYTDSTLNASSPMSRVEFAMVMDKLVSMYIDTPGTYTNLPTGNILVRCDGVTIDGAKNEEKDKNLIIIGDGVSSSAFINTDGANIVARGGEVSLSGIFGTVRAVASGVILTPDTKNIGVKTYSDNSQGIISATAEGSYINFEQQL